MSMERSLSRVETIRFFTGIISKADSRSCSIVARNLVFTRIRTEKVLSAVHELTGMANAIAYTLYNRGEASTR